MEDSGKLTIQVSGIMAVKEQNAEQEVQRGLDGDEDGVLLYYKFVAIPEPPEIKSWLLGMSASLGLLGRIRVAPDGINVTVGGTTSALREHMRVVASHPLFGGIDFKLGTSAAPVDPRAAAECGFTTLSARLVKELVTLGLHPSAAPPSLSMAGQHVDAQSFHRILQDAAAGQHAAPATDAGVAHGDEVNSKTPFSGSGEKDLEGNRTDETFFATSAHKKTVVMDVRNVYETRIGRMCPPKGVGTIYPMVRQYSDLPDWIDANEDLLRHKQILMYCTGGVRCEMASAYIRSKGTDYEDVLQLSGGIQRYLEAFPDGGYFTGKNFVFDHRLAVPSTNQDLLGSCLTCGAPFDDYSPRCRCSLCRLLVLVCKPCQLSSVRVSGDPEYVCELCREENRSSKSSKRVGERCSFPHGKLADEFESSNDPLSEKPDEVREQKLRILCLHGFRQSASSLKGRLNALKKKLRHRVEFVFVDAPHEIRPCTLQGESDESDCKQTAGNPGPSAARDHETPRTAGRKASNRRAWLTSPETAQSPQKHHLEGPDSSSRSIEIESLSNGRAPASKCDYSEAQFNPPNEAPSPLKRTPEDSDSTSGPGPNIGTVPRTCPRITHHAPHNRPQFHSQTEGWPESWNHLKETFSSLGPFEGVLGFSQGAAVAAALCDLRDSVTGHRHGVDFQFAIVCSGFRSRAPEHRRPPPSPPLSPSSPSAGSESSSIDCPSLHIFGGEPGLDRQIGVGESEELASLFSPRHRMIVRHNAGHIVSTRADHVLQYLQFLSQFEVPTRRGSRLS